MAVNSVDKLSFFIIYMW